MKRFAILEVLVMAMMLGSMVMGRDTQNPAAPVHAAEADFHEWYWEEWWYLGDAMCEVALDLTNNWQDCYAIFYVYTYIYDWPDGDCGDWFSGYKETGIRNHIGLFDFKAASDYHGLKCHWVVWDWPENCPRTSEWPATVRIDWCGEFNRGGGDYNGDGWADPDQHGANAELCLIWDNKGGCNWAWVRSTVDAWGGEGGFGGVQRHWP